MTPTEATDRPRGNVVAKTQSIGLGAVAATEIVVASMFTAALAISLALVVWGVLLIPVNAHDDHKLITAFVALVAVGVITFGLSRRQQSYRRFRKNLLPTFAVLAAVLLILELLGPWRSTFTVSIYIPCMLAGTVGGLRGVAAVTFATLLGYIGVNALSGVDWEMLKSVGDADGFVVNLIQIFAFGFVAYAITNWTASYVATVNRTLIEWDFGRPRVKLRTRALSVREVEVVQLLADGMSDKEIAGTLFLSKRTIENHVATAMKKTECRNRTELVVCAISEGLVPAIAIKAPDLTQ